MSEALICIFAKPPEPGNAKTRLIPALGPARAAALAEAFLQDTVALVRGLSWAELIVAATEPFARDYFRSDELWLQGAGDLGKRLERILQHGLKRAPMVFALGADSPGLPSEYLIAARDGLKESDAVIGPSRDGGFYLLGVRECPNDLLHGIRWSHAQTLAETMENLQRCGFRTAIIGEWFDVDTAEDLAHLREHLHSFPESAPKTGAFLGSLERSQQQ